MKKESLGEKLESCLSQLTPLDQLLHEVAVKVPKTGGRHFHNSNTGKVCVCICVLGGVPLQSYKHTNALSPNPQKLSKSFRVVWLRKPPGTVVDCEAVLA